MVGTTLIEIREHIESLATEDGEYYVVCGRTGDRPIPTAGKRFAGRAAATSAARATEQYRSALRRYDPQVPYYDLIVCQDTGSFRPPERHHRCHTTEPPRTLTTPVLDGSSSDTAREHLVECCHRSAAAVFEALHDADYDTVETAVMEAYFQHAETVTDQDDLCLCLLERIAAALGSALPPAEQARILEDAATRLPAPEWTEEPVVATLGVLKERGLLGGFTTSPWSIDPDRGRGSIVVHLAEYALTPQRGRLPVLPLVLDLYRRKLEWQPASVTVGAVESGWQLTIELARTPEPGQLATVPITDTA